MKPDLEGLLTEFLERRDAGENLSTERFLQEHGNDPGLRAALGQLLATDRMLPRSSDALPERIGRYRVRGLVSRGGTGQVLRVEDEDAPELPLAMKLLSTHALAQPRALARWRREGEVLQRLDVPGIVRFRELGIDGDTPFLVMDLVEGESLAELVRRGGEARALPPCSALALPGEGSHYERVARLVARIARSVAALHAEGLVHRDLKPQNVVLAQSGEPVLVDFGLAGGDLLTRMTHSGDLLGTPAYMSPEQAAGRTLRPTTDVWGLGTILYELLTLTPPHAGDTAVEVIDEVRRRRVRPVRSADPSVPDALARIVARALAHDPKWRYQDATALAQDLEAFAHGDPVQARSPCLRQRCAETWYFHRGAVLATSTLLVFAIAVAVLVRSLAGDSSELRDALQRGATAWIDGKNEALHAEAIEALRLAPEDARARVLGFRAGLIDRPPLDDDMQALLAAAQDLDEGRPREAIRKLSHVVHAAPGNALASGLLGLAANAAGDEDLAERELFAAVRLLPRSARLHMALGHVHRSAKRLADAEQLLVRAVELDPENAAAWTELAKTRYAREDLEAALAASERALALYGDQAPVNAWNVHATSLSGLGRKDEAAVAFDKMLELDPRNPLTLYNVAIWLDSEHRLEEATLVYSRLVEVAPQHTTARICLAWLHSGSDRENCEKCARAFEANPQLLDAGEAEAQMLAAIRQDRGAKAGVLETAVLVAERTGRTAELHRLLEELARDPEISDRRVGRITRALQRLPR